MCMFFFFVPMDFKTVNPIMNSICMIEKGVIIIVYACFKAVTVHSGSKQVMLHHWNANYNIDYQIADLLLCLLLFEVSVANSEHLLLFLQQMHKH